MEFINRKLGDRDVDKEFEKLIRSKRRRKISVCIVTLFIVLMIIFSFNTESEKGKQKREVTLEVRCDELTDNPEKMTKPELWKYISENGIILEEETCTIETGETVFDVLNRVCKEKDIQIEYSYTAGYDSYYVEGIQYLYEFDAGKRSGWVYLVDGKNTNYGCSQYKLKGGEKIVWKYVCDYK